MSSIYKKGRDGYYYYQTYLKNPKTGKKDKKVFHSLKTKEFTEAKIKQDELDNFYKKDNRLGFFRTNFKYFMKYNFLFSIPISVFITALIMKNHYESRLIQENAENKLVEEISDTLMKNQNLNDATKNKNLKVESSPIKDSTFNFVSEKKIISEFSIRDNEKVSPEYKIHRVENVSGVFDQARIYATIKKNISEDSKLDVCRKIRLDHKNYSNIVICIYQNTKFGIDLAKGKTKNINSYNVSDSWLAMYSYNSSEGEYFDSDPANYLKR